MTDLPLSIVRTDPLTSDPDDWRFRITSAEPHFRTTNNNVHVYGIQKPKPGSPGEFIDSTALNGTFDVDAYNPATPKELQFIAQSEPDVTDLTQLNLGAAFANVGHQALSAGAGFGTVVEGNRVYHCSTGGPYHDSYSSGDLVARHNYYHDVLSVKGSVPQNRRF